MKRTEKFFDEGGDALLTTLFIYFFRLCTSFISLLDKGQGVRI